MDSLAADRTTGFTYAAATSVGMRRANNQDSHALAIASSPQDWQARGHLFLVADGMGAHAAGEYASKMAADGVVHGYLKRPAMPPGEALRDAIREVNRQINERGESSIEFKGMGTTCSTLTLTPAGAVVAHVGDSRVYRLRQGRIEQLSFDHSLVWELQAAGELADADTVHLPKNIITRSLGPHPNVDVDLEGPFPLQQGDTFLLCSDGLTGEVHDDELGAVLSCLDPAEAAQFLVDLANLRGGPDNITVIVVRVDELPKDAEGAVDTPPTPVRSGSLASTLFVLLAMIGAAVGIGMYMAEQMMPAVIGGVAAVAFALAAVLARRGPENVEFPAQQRPSATPRRHGRGPHTTCIAAPTGKFVNDIAQMAQQVQEGAKENGAAIDWSRFQDRKQMAQAAAESKDWTSAVREYARAISSILAELRRPAAHRA